MIAKMIAKLRLINLVLVFIINLLSNIPNWDIFIIPKWYNNVKGISKKRREKWIFGSKNCGKAGIYRS